MILCHEVSTQALARVLAKFGDATIVGTRENATRLLDERQAWSAFFFDVELPDGSAVSSWRPPQASSRNSSAGFGDHPVQSSSSTSSANASCSIHVAVTSTSRSRSWLAAFASSS